MRLDDLRADLADVDRRILELVARRQELARAVGHAKHLDGRALRDYAQEKDVLDRARVWSRELGLATELAEGVLRLLMRHALTAQERQRIAADAAGGGRRALVIGGAGRMGTWFSRFLSSQGFAVEVADPREPVDDVPHVADWRASSLEHDLIVVATELRTARTILEELATRRPTGVVFDIGSLKSPLRGPLRALADAGVDVVSIHPMFGPDTALLSGRHVILVDLGRRRANGEVRALFSSTMAELVEMNLDQHDRVIAYVLGVSHAVNIAFFTALAESGEAAGHLAALSSTTFDEQLAVARRVAWEHPHLYFEIQHLNDFGTVALTALRQAVDRVCHAVERGDEPAFAGLMERGRAYLGARVDGRVEGVGGAG